MNFREYVPLAMRTNKPKETKLENLLNACLGLVGEFAEASDLTERNEIKDELSDIFWYVALLHHTLETDLLAQPTDYSLLHCIGMVCDTVKKHAFQGHEFQKEKLDLYAKRLLHALYKVCEYLEFHPSEIMEYNVEKLKKRYPDGFAVEKSVYREEYINAGE